MFEAFLFRRPPGLCQPQLEQSLRFFLLQLVLVSIASISLASMLRQIVTLIALLRSSLIREACYPWRDFFFALCLASKSLVPVYFSTMVRNSQCDEISRVDMLSLKRCTPFGVAHLSLRGTRKETKLFIAVPRVDPSDQQRENFFAREEG